jgi:hypothetical protein
VLLKSHLSQTGKVSIFLTNEGATRHWATWMRSRGSSVAEKAQVQTETTIHELAANGDIDGIRKRLVIAVSFFLSLFSLFLSDVLFAWQDVGCDVADEFGNTMLHIAAARGYLLVIRELVQASFSFFIPFFEVL